MNLLPSPDTRPLRSLTTAFTAWKALLLAVALGASIGPDYDTSTAIFFARLYGRAPHEVPALAARLTRWDALYFMHSAREGYVYEQEWAFGAGLPTVAAGLVRLARGVLGARADAVAEPLAGIAVAHVSHLVAVLALYRLTALLSGDRRLAYVAALLHVVSPAGLFMSAPYNESPFSGLSFLGNLLFATGLRDGATASKRGVCVVAAGVAFGLATTFRSNGLLSGLLFAVEAIRCLAAFAQGPAPSKLLALVPPVLGGLCVAAGSIVPQAVAWMRYCRPADADADAELRPWCARTIPSIYTFVQEEYWDVGFLNYWTLNQVPLFLLAAPMLTILLISGVEVLREPSRGLKTMTAGTKEEYRTVVRTLAASQVVLAVLAITNYHVQIITRLSSGCPVWYWWVAGCLADKRREVWGAGIVIFMVMYGGIQGGLFASFLPPA